MLEPDVYLDPHQIVITRRRMPPKYQQICFINQIRSRLQSLRNEQKWGKTSYFAMLKKIRKKCLSC